MVSNRFLRSEPELRANAAERAIGVPEDDGLRQRHQLRCQVPAEEPRDRMVRGSALGCGQVIRPPRVRQGDERDARVLAREPERHAQRRHHHVGAKAREQGLFLLDMVLERGHVGEEPDLPGPRTGEVRVEVHRHELMHREAFVGRELEVPSDAREAHVVPALTQGSRDLDRARYVGQSLKRHEEDSHARHRSTGRRFVQA